MACTVKWRTGRSGLERDGIHMTDVQCSGVRALQNDSLQLFMSLHLLYGRLGPAGRSFCCPYCYSAGFFLCLRNDIHWNKNRLVQSCLISYDWQKFGEEGGWYCFSHSALGNLVLSGIITGAHSSWESIVHELPERRSHGAVWKWVWEERLKLPIS